MNKKLVIFLTMSLVLVSCGKSGDKEVALDNATPEIADPGNDSGSGSSDLPNEALTFSTNVDLLNFTATQAAKYQKAIEMVKLVVATEEFRNRVLNHTYNGSKQFVNNNGKTNAQIYKSILEAAETLQPAKNNRMDLGVELYYASTNVVGYTYASSTQIWVNRKYFDTYLVNSVASNLFHEWLHKLGYGHDSSATARRPYSVPYAIGYMVRDIGKKFL